MLNEDGMPKLRINGSYRQMLNSMDSKSDGETVNYIKDKIRSAVWLIKSLDQRQRTIYKVAESIVKHQREFLEKGIDYLRPLVLRDVADDIQMHESTVSRVVSNKYMHTPRGLFLMKYFFHSGIDSDTGEDISSLTVKKKIQGFIEAEDPRKPLSRFQDHEDSQRRGHQHCPAYRGEVPRRAEHSVIDRPQADLLSSHPESARW